MTPTQEQKAAAFRALHEGEPFVIPNPWDAGSAQGARGARLQGAGDARAPGSRSRSGAPTASVTLDEVVDHVRVLDRATELPVSVDLENGYGPEPEDAALRDRAGPPRPAPSAARSRTTTAAGGIYGLDHAAERVAAAVRGGAGASASRSRSRRAPRTTSAATRTSTTRSPACRPTSEAGADVLYAPGLRERRRDPRGLRGHLQAGQRARPPRAVDERDRRRRAASGSASAARSPGSRSARWRAPPSRSATAATSRPFARGWTSRTGWHQPDGRGESANPMTRDGPAIEHSSPRAADEVAFEAQPDAGCSPSPCSARAWPSSTAPWSTWRCRTSAATSAPRPAALQWILNGYLLTLASLILLGGSLGDRYGRRRIFMLGAGLFTAASLLCAIAPNAELLIVARLLQGIGGALLTPGSLAMIESSFRPADRARAIGAWSGLGGVATAIGPLLGGYLVEAVSWRAIFLINLPIGIFVVAMARRHVPETRDPTAERAARPAGRGAGGARPRGDHLRPDRGPRKGMSPLIAAGRRSGGSSPWSPSCSSSGAARIR